MHTRPRLLLLWLALCPISRGDSIPVFRKTVSEVGLTLVASDRAGRPLPVLVPTDIVLTDEGRAIPNFALRQAADLPLRLGILLDLSESTRSSRAATRDALEQFLGGLLQPGDDVLWLGFDSRIRVEQAAAGARPPEQLFAGAANGSLTALFDAVYAACQHRFFGATEGPQHSAVILFSDGEDNLSRHDLAEAIARAQFSDIAIYTISAHPHRGRFPGDLVLQRLAATTGGQDFVVHDSRQAGSALAEISNQLRAAYRLYYRPPGRAHGREFRRVRVLPAHSNGTRIRVRDGYFAVPDPDE